MPVLAYAQRAIAVLVEILRQRQPIAPLGQRADRWSEAVNARRAGPLAHQKARARWIAERRLRVAVEERRAACGERIQRRRLRQRMSAERGDPVVEIVDNDEEDVGLGRSRGV